jgi:hypothetical protein
MRRLHDAAAGRSLRGQIGRLIPYVWMRMGREATPYGSRQREGTDVHVVWMRRAS